MGGKAPQIGVLDQITGKRSNIRSPAEELRAPDSPPEEGTTEDAFVVLGKLHDAIVDLVDSHNEVSRVNYGNPFATGLYVKNQSLVSGTTVAISHKLACRVRYMVVNVRGASAVVYRPADNTEDESTLKLTPGATFTCDVFIYPDL